MLLCMCGLNAGKNQLKTPANVTDFGEALFKQARKNLDAITLWRNG
ncbi:hypothetical protein T479_15230 [Lysinibacillus varians]|mgnify:FL=1|nr:hypothetical protein T479_15230 [Lysinibacillus varians]